MPVASEGNSRYVFVSGPYIVRATVVVNKMKHKWPFWLSRSSLKERQNQKKKDKEMIDFWFLLTHIFNDFSHQIYFVFPL